MDYPIHIGTINMEFSVNFVFEGIASQTFYNMMPYAAFHLSLHCLTKYECMFTGIRKEKS